MLSYNKKIRWRSLDIILTNFLSDLGGFVGRNPSHFVIFPVLLSLFFATGLQNLIYVTDPEYLFVPTNALGLAERAKVEKYFPTNYNSYVIGQETRQKAEGHVIVMAKDGESVLRPEIWREIRRLDSIITGDLKVLNSFTNSTLTFEDVCAKFNEKCLRNDFLALGAFLPEIRDGTFNLTYPTILDPFTFTEYRIPLNFGGISFRDEDRKVVNDSTAVRLHYMLDSSTASKEYNSRLWENAFLEMLSDNIKSEKLIICQITPLSIETELVRNVDSAVELLPVSVALVVAFTVWNSLELNCVKAKPYVALLGILSIIQATLAAWGLLIYCGVQWQSINLAVLFILLGVGLDDVFIMLSAWKRSPSYLNVTDRMTLTYKEAAVSITITSLTNVVGFFVGAFIPVFPAVKIFCLYAGIGILFIYFWTLTFFGGVLAVSGLAEAANRHSITCRPISSFGTSGCRCFGNPDIRPPATTIEDNNNEGKKTDSELLFTFFRDYVADILSRFPTRLIVILLFLIYLLISIWAVLRMEEGLERRKLARDDSFLASYYHAEDQLFRTNPYRLQVVITEPLDYSDSKIRSQISDFIKSLQDSKFISNDPDFVESWLDAFDTFLEKKRKMIHKLSTDNESSFVSELLNLLKDTPVSVIGQNVRFNENRSRIIASRFLIQTDEVNNAVEEKAMIKEIRKLAEAAPFKVVIFHPFFIFFDQFIQILPTTVICVVTGISIVMAVTVILIPNFICAFWVTLSLLSIELGVVGFMVIMKINLDVISMICLIMCVGFSVDFSAHVSYHFISTTEKSVKEKMKSSLSAYGVPILQSAISTILGVSGLFLHPSYILNSFAKLLILVIVLGILHGLVLLPVLLSMSTSLSRQSKERKKPKVSTTGGGEEISGTFEFFPQSVEMKELSRGIVNGAFEKQDEEEGEVFLRRKKMSTKNSDSSTSFKRFARARSSSVPMTFLSQNSIISRLTITSTSISPRMSKSSVKSEAFQSCIEGSTFDEVSLNEEDNKSFADVKDFSAADDTNSVKTVIADDGTEMII